MVYQQFPSRLEKVSNVKAVQNQTEQFKREAESLKVQVKSKVEEMKMEWMAIMDNYEASAIDKIDNLYDDFVQNVKSHQRFLQNTVPEIEEMMESLTCFDQPMDQVRANATEVKKLDEMVSLLF